MVLVHGALEGAHGIGSRRMVIVADDFDFAAVDAAFGVDLVGSELCGARDRGTGDRCASAITAMRIGSAARTVNRHEARAKPIHRQ